MVLDTSTLLYAAIRAAHFSPLGMVVLLVCLFVLIFIFYFFSSPLSHLVSPPHSSSSSDPGGAGNSPPPHYCSFLVFFCGETTSAFSSLVGLRRFGVCLALACVLCCVQLPRTEWSDDGSGDVCIRAQHGAVGVVLAGP